jgi:hypothetical protein
MLMNLASLYRPFDSLVRSLHTRKVLAAEHEQELHGKSHASDNAERLERIAIYARAGYFNMGYTLEMFHVIGEVTPD